MSVLVVEQQFSASVSSIVGGVTPWDGSRLRVSQLSHMDHVKIYVTQRCGQTKRRKTVPGMFQPATCAARHTSYQVQILVNQTTKGPTARMRRQPQSLHTVSIRIPAWANCASPACETGLWQTPASITKPWVWSDLPVQYRGFSGASHGAMGRCTCRISSLASTTCRS